MTFSQTLTALAEIGGRIEYNGERVVIDAPEDQLTPELMAALREHKGAFLHLVTMPPPDPPEEVPRVVWDQETAELVEWYVTVRRMLPAAPFRLTAWCVVTNTERFRESLDKMIVAGSEGAPVVTLRRHLAALHTLLSTETRRAA